MLGLCVVAYLFNYLKECVLDSINGGIRAIGNLITIPLDDDVFLSNQWELINIVFLVSLIWGPVIGYCKYINLTENSGTYLPVIDKIFWVLLGYGIFIFPMGLFSFYRMHLSG